MSSGDILIKIDPFGDSCRKQCSDDGGKGNVRQIYVRHGTLINSIQTVNELNGGLVLVEKHGVDGPNFNMITLRPSESIISVSGFSDIVNSWRAITSIKISTNYAEYGPYGSEKGSNYRSAFRLEVEAGRFARFHGYANWQGLTGIGIYVNTKASSALGTGASSLPRLTL